MSAVSMAIGRKVGRFLAVFTWGKIKAKLQGKTETAAKAGIVVVAILLSTGASCVRDFGIGVGIGVVEGVRDCVKYPNEPDCRPPVVSQTPTPVPTSAPLPSPTAGNNEPSATPTPTPSHPPTPAPTPTPTLRPTSVPPTAPPTPTCAPRPGPEPVTIAYRGGCPRYMEPLPFEGEGATVPPPGFHILCAAKAGIGNGATAWRLGFGMGRQGMLLEQFDGRWLQFNPGRGCTDAYGRYFPDCANLYQHPEGETAPYSWGGYSRPVWCEDLPVPTAVPVPSATPAPGPGRTDHCTCQVICTTEFLGWNKPGVPPDVVVGGDARIDITCRQAQFNGDQRGQPVDRSSGPDWCEPSENPVIWHVSTPGGVRQHQFNDGYGMSLQNVQSGHYNIHAVPNPNARYRNGEPVKLCGWGHNDSVRDTLEFDIH